MRLARRMPCGFTYYASAWKICQQRAVVSSVIPCRNGIKRIQRKRRHVECFTRRSSQASTCRLKKRHAKHSSRVVESDGDRDCALAGQVGIPQARPSTASATFTAATFPRPAGSASPSFEGRQGGMGANNGAPCRGDALPLLPVAGTTPPGEAPGLEGDPRVRGQANQGNAALVALANLQTSRDRDVTPRGHPEVLLTQPGATSATPGDTSF